MRASMRACVRDCMCVCVCVWGGGVMWGVGMHACARARRDCYCVIVYVFFNVSVHDC